MVAFRVSLDISKSLLLLLLVIWIYHFTQTKKTYIRWWVCGWKWTNQRTVLPAQLIALPRVSQQGGDGVDLDGGRLSILENG